MPLESGDDVIMSITDADLVDWIIAEGVLASSLEALVSGLGQRLLERGFAVSRVYLSMPTVHPAVRIVGAVWRRETGASPEAIDHARGANLFQTSPFGAMLASNQLRRRWRLETGEGVEDFAILATLKAAGATDYFAALTPFRNPEAPTLEGIAMSFTADRPDGFHDDELALIDRLVMPLALAAYRIALFDVAASLLDTYVGLSAGRRVLRGEIQRGRGETVYAALLMADLRGFTRFADRTAADQVIGLLDTHFDAMAEPITSRGGDILKFMGDGLLAVFPIDGDRDKVAASRAAVDAATDALARNCDINQAMPPESRLELDIALHLGEIFYGNIGSANRLDFTVVGSAVNESSRMEALCGELGTPLVMSAGFAAICGRPTASLGWHRLRGVADDRELYTLEAPDTRASRKRERKAFRQTE